MSPLRSIWLDILTPSADDERPYNMLTTGISHAVLGAAASALLQPLVPWFAAVPLVALAYWLLKERRDLKLGGGRLDGFLDTCFVALGALYAGPAWWPLSILLLGLGKPYLMRLR